MPSKGPTQESLKYLAKREREFGLLLPACVLVVMVAISFGFMMLAEGRWDMAITVLLGCAVLISVVIVLVARLRRQTKNRRSRP